MLLAIDTSAGTSVALVDPERHETLAVRETEDTRRHAEVLGPFLAEVFDEAGRPPSDVTAVAAGMGPGPFTGLRVGIAAARTFAAARAVPCLPLVSHDAVAAGHDGPLVVLTDARRREVYWSAYDASGTRVAGPGLTKPTDLDEVIRASRPEAVDWTRVTAATIPAWRLGLIAADRLAAVPTSAGAAGSAGAGPAGPVGFAADEPLYLRDPDVTVPGAPKRVVR